MTDPDVYQAVVSLQREKILPAPTAAFLMRLTRGDLISVHLELRLAFYFGVMLLTAGIGLLFQAHYERIGPLGIAAAVALLAVTCAAWVVRQAPPFAWGPSSAEHPAFDFILLLAAISTSADLAYIEVIFSPLGTRWQWHMFWVALAAGAASLRYDSRLLFSFALSSFCAWCGFSLARPQDLIGLGHRFTDLLRRNMFCCGFLFLMIGLLLHRTNRKAHFEPSASYFGWVLILATLLSGIGADTDQELLFTLLLLGVGAGLCLALYFRRFPLFAMGCLSIYVALTALFYRWNPGYTALLAWYTLASILLLYFLLRIHRRFREEP